MVSPKPGMSFPNRRYDFTYDAESLGSGSPANTAQPTRLIKRLITRKGRWLAGVLLAAGVVVYLTGPGSGAGRTFGTGWEGKVEVKDMEDIWDEKNGVVGDDAGYGGGLRPPTPVPRPVDDKVTGTPTTPKTLNTWYQGYIPPFDPDISLLPAPSSLFPEVNLPRFLKPPLSNPFPDIRLREIVSPDPPEEDVVSNHYVLAKDSFSQSWVGQKVWDEPRGEVRSVQLEGKAFPKESKSEKKIREERRDAVRRGFAWAWQGYKDHAWGHDEIKPVSEIHSDPFNNWGASIIDTLDTLLLMGFSDEYNLCRPHVNQLNFRWVNGRDWSEGYTSEPSPTDDEETPAEVWFIMRDRNVALPVFETGIRYLGGLLGAYDLSGDTLLLERAKELGDILGKAFNTESGLPAGRMDPGSDNAHKLGQVSIAEVGSMSLEMIRLSQATGGRKYQDLAQRAMDYLEERVIPRAPLALRPMIPMWFLPDAALTSPMTGGLTLGGLSDSYYEYLIKTYKLLGASTSAEQWKRIYEQSVDVIKKTLYVDVDVVPGRDLLALGKLEGGRLIPEIEHLTCFAGAMLGLGARLLDRPTDQIDAERFTQSCYWLSAATPTGLQPEVVEFYGATMSKNLMYHNVTAEGRVYRPVLKDESELDESITHKDRNEVWRWNDGTPVEFGEGGEKPELVERLKGVPAGTIKVNGRGINRPETIESIFYMYRLTGDRKWQDRGWKMYVSWVSTAKVAGGLSSIHDVTSEAINFGDNMESFMFAETLKYHFLLQSEPDVLSLDDYVLNTEAHPFLTAPNLKPGSQKLWTPPSPDSPEADLGVRAQGTDAQKWSRLDVLYKVQGRHPPPVQDGGGKGMGGGGGDPNHRPKAPGF